MGAHARIKAVLQYRATPGFLRQIAALEDESLTIVVVPETDKRAFAREMHDTDVLLYVLERVTADTIEAAPRLKLIQKLGITRTRERNAVLIYAAVRDRRFAIIADQGVRASTAEGLAALRRHRREALDGRLPRERRRLHLPRLLREAHGRGPQLSARHPPRWIGHQPALVLRIPVPVHP